MAYRGRWFVRRRVWVCGDLIDVDTYPVFQQPGQRRKKCRPTRAVQAELNRKNAELRLIRLVHANFGTADLTLDLTFRREMEPEEAVRCLRAYFKRLRRRYRKEGAEVKYVYVLERGRSGRTHIHMILNRGPLERDELEELWEEGYANARRLQFSEEGVAPLVEYITKGGRTGKRAAYRRWSSSTNLIRPEPEEKDGAVTAKELAELADEVERCSAADRIRKEWPGYELVTAEAVRNLCNGGTYVHMRLCRRELWQGRRPAAHYIVGDIGEGIA